MFNVPSRVVIAVTFLIPLLLLIPGFRIITMFTALILTGFLSLNGTEKNRRTHGWCVFAPIDILLTAGLLFLSLATGFLFRGFFEGTTVQNFNFNLNFIWMILISAFIEETFFHSWLLVTWFSSEKKSYAYGKLQAIFLSATLFGVIHLWQGWFAILYSALIGIFYSLVFLQWRRIFPLIAAHFFYNLLVIFVYS